MDQVSVRSVWLETVVGSGQCGLRQLLDQVSVRSVWLEAVVGSGQCQVSTA